MHIVFTWYTLYIHCIHRDNMPSINIPPRYKWHPSTISSILIISERSKFMKECICVSILLSVWIWSIIFICVCVQVQNITLKHIHQYPKSTTSQLFNNCVEMCHKNRQQHLSCMRIQQTLWVVRFLFLKCQTITRDNETFAVLSKWRRRMIVFLSLCAWLFIITANQCWHLK